MKMACVSILTCLLIAACSDEKKPYKPPLPETPATPLFQSDRQALDKARGVGQIQDERARDLESKSHEQ